MSESSKENSMEFFEDEPISDPKIEKDLGSSNGKDLVNFLDENEGHFKFSWHSCLYIRREFVDIPLPTIQNKDKRIVPENQIKDPDFWHGYNSAMKAHRSLLREKKGRRHINTVTNIVLTIRLVENSLLLFHKIVNIVLGLKSSLTLQMLNKKLSPEKVEIECYESDEIEQRRNEVNEAILEIGRCALDEINEKYVDFFNFVSTKDTRGINWYAHKEKYQNKIESDKKDLQPKYCVEEFGHVLKKSAIKCDGDICTFYLNQEHPVFKYLKEKDLLYDGMEDLEYEMFC